MKRILILIILLGGGIQCLVAGKDSRVADWQSDIDYLATRLEIQHPHPFLYITRERFHQAAAALKERVPTLSDAQMLYAVMELLSPVSDDHTCIWYPECPAFAERKMAPVGLYPFADGIHVTYASLPYAGIVGKKVRRIGSLPAQEALLRVARLANGDNPRQKQEMARILLSIPELLAYCGIVTDDSKLPLVVENDDGSETCVTIAAEPIILSFPHIVQGPFPAPDDQTRVMNEKSSAPQALWLDQIETNYWFRYLPEKKTMYLRLKSMQNQGNEDYTTFYQRFFTELDSREVEKLVIDLRNNGGGNHYEMPLLKGLIARPGLDSPHRLFIIINRGVGSAAQHFANVFTQYTRATFVGEPTGTRPNFCGEMRTFPLPRHPEIVIGLSNKIFQEADYSNFDLNLAPAIRAPLTAADFRANRDLAFERIDHYGAIMATVRKTDSNLSKTYEAGGWPELATAWAQGKSELLETGVDPEWFFTDFIDNWFFAHQKNPHDTIALLTLVHSECPDSISYNYLLGTYHQKTGRLEKAREFYHACLELNPAHLLARSKLALLDLDEATTAR